MRACLGWWFALAAVAFAFLSSVYLMAGVRLQGDPHRLTISGAVAHSDATYGVSLALVAVLVGLLLALGLAWRSFGFAKAVERHLLNPDVSR